MEQSIFSHMEMDAIGEIMNISLGSSATAVSNLLDHRVGITTPSVSVVKAKDFSLGELQPAVGIEIEYISGLEGSNLMLLKRSDIKVIVDILLGYETPEEEFELNELTVSAVCEVMNQMMGAASTALSDFLGRHVNISPPNSIELDDFVQFKKDRFPDEEEDLVVVHFSLSIEGTLESEFMNIMSVPLARTLVSSFALGEETQPADVLPAQNDAAAQSEGGGALSQDEIEALMQSMSSGQQKPAADRTLTQDEIEALMNPQSGAGQAAPPQAPVQPAAQTTPPQPQPGGTSTPAQPSFGQGVPGYPPGYYPPYPYPYPPELYQQPATPKVIPTQPVLMHELSRQPDLSEEQTQNLDLIMSVPLEVTVEIGRTRRKVQDILSFTKGSLVVLDKLAGDQVDLFVNGKCIARGDVVVIDDNFGIRITEILQNNTAENLLK